MAKAPAGVKGSAARLTTLKRRWEYHRVRKGARWAAPAFVLEAKARDGESGIALSEQPRFGFTVTRQIGKAVERNRIRRRLKAAVTDVAMDHAKRDFDYVLIARRPALTSEYGTLVSELVKALDRVHRSPARGRRPREAGTIAQDKSR
jgi:ribonuclease P protein component